MQVAAKEIALLMEAGHICRYARRFREAREIFQGVAALLPVRETADLALAAVACNEHKFDEAEKLCRSVLQLNARSVAAYAQLAEILIARGDYASVTATLKTAQNLRPGEAMLSLVRSLQRLADLLSQQG
jgi:tetratricopeptide (TPR) repeat protein